MKRLTIPLLILATLTGCQHNPTYETPEQYQQRMQRAQMLYNMGMQMFQAGQPRTGNRYHVTPMGGGHYNIRSY